jgi:aquaporin Z
MPARPERYASRTDGAVTDAWSAHQTACMVPRGDHWREYTIEGVLLGAFLVSAMCCATLLQHPASVVARLLVTPLQRRIPMAIAMGLTAIGLIYSPAGRRSGAHMNPAVTLAFLRLGKVDRRDAVGYISGQFAGAILGTMLSSWLLRGLAADPAVNYVATVPGIGGPWAAFAAETLISFLLMATVLAFANHRELMRYAGLAAGFLVAIYIVVEAPLSGTSMNPARTLGPALLAGTWGSLWIYFAAPLLGMVGAAEAFTRVARRPARCAKLHHTDVRCIFRCGYAHTSPETLS